MKKICLLFPFLLLLNSCESQNAKKQQKEFLDKLLAGEEISFYQLENSKGEVRRSPYDTALGLGYSEEDLEKLQKVVVKLPSAERK